MLKKVISDGQRGVNVAALQAAKECGLETGGLMSKNFHTEEGEKPEYEELYGMEKSHSRSHLVCVKQNVLNSDATLILKGNDDFVGIINVENVVIANKKIFYLLQLNYKDECLMPLNNGDMCINDWLRFYRVNCLNVFGNRESKCPGIQEIAYEFLTQIFRLANLGEK